MVSRRPPRRCWILSGNRCSISSTIPMEGRLCKMKRVGMNVKNETVRFSMKPNPFLYALEVTRDALLGLTIFGLASGIPLILSVINSERPLLTIVVVLLITYVVLGLAIFIIGFA